MQGITVEEAGSFSGLTTRKTIASPGTDGLGSSLKLALWRMAASTTDNLVSSRIGQKAREVGVGSVVGAS
ncbi:hypothetical protein R1flu_005941 [Riccia fluitans]|uniref:Uncharacterized protein n=1 Tax=Riccia fluitans TaxID=41844 RepID=A0ABD1YYL6_9MARC